eukprot:jgi/Mesvir1/26799/Mv20566-RA.1
MGKPIFYEAASKPVTTCIIALCCGIHLYFLKKGNIGYADVGLSYERFVTDGQYWRAVTASLSHISLLHLLFNMSSLWGLGVIETAGTMFAMGSWYYLKYSVVIMVLSMLLLVGIYWLLINKLGQEQHRHVTAVGYSAVVFGWMTVLSLKRPSYSLNILGASVPFSLAPFGSLVLTSLLVPQASFLGHLCGIVVGLAIGWDLLEGVSDYWWACAFFWVVAAVVYSLHKSRVVRIPFLRDIGLDDPLDAAASRVRLINGAVIRVPQDNQV